MKIKLFALVAVSAQLQALPVLLGQGTANSTPTPTGPHIQFSETSFNFDKVQPTDQPRHEFIFTNTGNAVLEIIDVRPGCGCTTAGVWDRQVQPGKTGKIPLQFNPANFSGPISKGATVTCNDPAQGSIYLQFQATVWRPIDLTPQYVYFLPVEDELTNDIKVVRIVSNLEQPLTLEPPQSTTPVFQTDLKELKPGKEFELRVTYSGPVSNASSQGTITLKTSASTLPTLSLTAVVMPQPPLVAIPAQIQLPASPLSPDYHYPETIRNNGHTPVVLSDPSVNAEGVTVELQELEPGKTFKLNLGFPTNFQAPPGKTLELAVKTSHPKYPVFRVPITQSAPAPLPVGSATPAAGAH